MTEEERIAFWGDLVPTITSQLGSLAIMGDFQIVDLIRNIMSHAENKVMEEREATDRAYKERNQLVALLSTCFPSGKAKTAIEGWDESWHGCVYIDLPWGQASWHYHDSDDWMFDHLPPYQGKWDGHTTEEKYSKMADAIRARGQA